MLPPDYSRKLRRVELRARLVSEQLLGGRLGSIFKGRGMDFADVREYVPGDDVRRIDWNVTARLRKPFIKRHIEERELVVMLLVDMSGSSEFGTADPVSHAGTKREMAAILAGALAFGAVRQGDRVGLLLFTDRVERYDPPRKSRSHVTRMLHELLFQTPQSSGTSLTNAFRFLNNVVTKPALVFVISDFDDGADEAWVREMKATNQRHEVIGLRLLDRREWELPDVGWALLRDAETGDVMELDTSDPVVRDGWKASCDSQTQKLAATFRASQVPLLSLQTEESWPQRLQPFLDHCARRRIA